VRFTLARQSSYPAAAPSPAVALRLLAPVLAHAATFESATGALRISADAAGLSGRARGLLTEELGIALGVHIALRRMGLGQGAGVVDVDNPPHAGLAGPTGSRPDYFIVSEIGPRQHTIDTILECKGRSRRGRSVRDTFAKGLRQAESTYMSATAPHCRRVVAGAVVNGTTPEVLALEVLAPLHPDAMGIRDGRLIEPSFEDADPGNQPRAPKVPPPRHLDARDSPLAYLATKLRSKGRVRGTTELFVNAQKVEAPMGISVEVPTGRLIAHFGMLSTPAEALQQGNDDYFALARASQREFLPRMDADDGSGALVSGRGEIRVEGEWYPAAVCASDNAYVLALSWRDEGLAHASRE
jgi:hypothetical protein